MHSFQTEIQRDVDCRSAKYYSGYCCWIFSSNIYIMFTRYFLLKAQQLVRGLLVVVSTGPGWSVVKELAGLRCVVVGLLDESQWVSVKFESEFQREVLVISGRNAIRVFFNASQTLISGSAGVRQCVAGISASSRKIMIGSQWLSEEFHWILVRNFAVYQYRCSNMMGYDAAFWWGSVLGLCGYCGVLWVSCGSCLRWIWGSGVVGRLGSCVKGWVNRGGLRWKLLGLLRVVL